METMNYRSFKEQVREVLRKRGWKQEDLAQAMGVTPGYISHVLRGGDSCTKEVIEKVAAAADLHPTYFDLYIRHRLFELGTSVPALIDIGRSLSQAKSRQQFSRITSRLAS